MPNTNILSYGNFGVFSYRAPSKRARGFYHGENPTLDLVQWSYVQRSDCGTYWKVSSAVSGFASEAEAVAAARKVVGN